MGTKGLETWELWFPGAGATGLPFARGRLDPATVMWVHSAPRTIEVTVRDGKGLVLAQAKSLLREGEYIPMTRLERAGSDIRREDRWPTQADLGALVILPGGEVGTLVEWWNAEDGLEWRWRVEYYNNRR